jgi:hypothetical protein
MSNSVVTKDRRNRSIVQGITDDVDVERSKIMAAYKARIDANERMIAFCDNEIITYTNRLMALRGEEGEDNEN